MARANQIQLEAARWVTWVDSDRTSGTMQTEFVSWLAADPEHRVAFVVAHRLWRRMDRLIRLSQAELMRANPVQAPSSEWPRRVAVVAGVLICGLALWLTWEQGLLSQPRWNSYKTGRGALQSLTLSDGSSVTLNTDTEVHMQISRTSRAVQLVKGEALFKVAHDRRHPFSVLAGNLVIRDVGTVFAVRIRGEHDVEVVVQEGMVAIDERAVAASPAHDGEGELFGERPPQTVVTRAMLGGETVLESHSPEEVIYSVSREEVRRRLAWTAGRLEFDGQPLSEAVEEFNRYNRQQLRVDDPQIAGTPLGGRFETANIRSFIQALRETYSIEAQEGAGADDAIRLYREPK